jgi:hypothetical protein
VVIAAGEELNEIYRLASGFGKTVETAMGIAADSGLAAFGLFVSQQRRDCLSFGL